MKTYIMPDVPEDHVVVRMPKPAFDLVCETLEADMKSPAFDPDLRKQIRTAYDSIVVCLPNVDEDAGVYLDGAPDPEDAT